MREGHHGRQMLRPVHNSTRCFLSSRTRPDKNSAISAPWSTDAFKMPSTELTRAQLAERPLPLAELLVTTGVAPSKNEAKKLLQGNGICVNNVRVSEVQRTITAEDFIDRQVLVLRKGAKTYHVVRLLAE